MENTNGTTKPYANTTPNHGPCSAITTFTAGVAQGNAPINALLQQGYSAKSNTAARQAKVQKEIDDAMSKFQTSP